MTQSLYANPSNPCQSTAHCQFLCASAGSAARSLHVQCVTVCVLFTSTHAYIKALSVCVTHPVIPEVSFPIFVLCEYSGMCVRFFVSEQIHASHRKHSLNMDEPMTFSIAVITMSRHLAFLTSFVAPSLSYSNRDPGHNSPSLLRKLSHCQMGES